MPGQGDRIARYNTSGTATIAASASTSDAINIGNFAYGVFAMPAAITGTAVSFTVSTDNITFVALYNDSGALISVPVVASGAYRFPPNAMGAAYLKIVSNGTEAAARSIQYMLKG